MPLASIMRLAGQRPTSQELADMALSEDRAARAARARGEEEEAKAHEEERDALCDLI